MGPNSTSGKLYEVTDSKKVGEGQRTWTGYLKLQATERNSDCYVTEEAQDWLQQEAEGLICIFKTTVWKADWSRIRTELRARELRTVCWIHYVYYFISTF